MCEFSSCTADSSHIGGVKSLTLRAAHIITSRGHGNGVASSSHLRRDNLGEFIVVYMTIPTVMARTTRYEHGSIVRVGRSVKAGAQSKGAARL